MSAPLRVLLADDSKAIRMMVGKMLVSLGCQVVEACNGKEAVQKIHEEGPFALLLLDWNMPEMDGYQVLCNLRDSPVPNGPRIVMVTTETETSRMVTALEAGASEYLMKPFTREMLVSKLEMMQVGIHGP